jgi:hypothetical protein
MSRHPAPLLAIYSPRPMAPTGRPEHNRLMMNSGHVCHRPRGKTQPPVPPCSRCGQPTQASALTIPRAFVSRVGAPVPPPVALPTWRCPSCGLQQPRIDDAA